MSLTTPGVWAANVWASTAWAQDVWFEGIRVTPTVEQHGGTSRSTKKKKKVYRTEEIYEILQRAREKEQEPGISPEELARREAETQEAEAQLRQILGQRFKERSGLTAKSGALNEFVSGLNFDKNIGEVPAEDMEQILLILFIEEMTHV